MTDQQSKIEAFATRVGRAVTDGILAANDFVEGIADQFYTNDQPYAAGPDGPHEAEHQNNRLKNGLWELLNDEFDFPAGDAFEAVWADFEELLEAHGMETEVVKRHNLIMDKLREEDEILAKADEIRRKRQRVSQEAAREMRKETEATVYDDGKRYGPMSDEQIEKSARWVNAQEPGETITFESTISQADQAKILARAEALRVVERADKMGGFPIVADRPAEEQAETIEREADHG